MIAIIPGQIGERQSHRFIWINEWTESADARGNADGIDLTVPDWFYRPILEDVLVPTVDHRYFALTGAMERWLYRIVPKHAGRQSHGWRFEFRHLGLGRVDGADGVCVVNLTGEV